MGTLLPSLPTDPHVFNIEGPIDLRSREDDMSVARVSKITAASSSGFDDAVRSGLERASRTLRGITGLHIVEQKAKVHNGRIEEFRVTMEVTFVLDE
jgi:flavin-binding protein dodecin